MAYRYMAVMLVALSAYATEEQTVLRLDLVPARSSTAINDMAELEVIDTFFRHHPEYDYRLTTGIALPEGMNEAQAMMAFAAERGPDVFPISIRLVQNYIRMGLLLPLDELLEQHKQKHPDWVMPDLGLSPDHWSAARGEDGQLYAMVSSYWILSLWYRRDLFAEAGIIPPRPPKDWEEYYRLAQALTFPDKKVKNAPFQMGQYGAAIRTGYEAGFIFTNFVWQAGGNMTLQERTCPDDGTLGEFPKEDQVCACPTCGRSLEDQPRTWKLAYGDEAGQRALRFYKRLRWSEWVRCPDCQTPNDLPTVTCQVCSEPNPVRDNQTASLPCQVCRIIIAVPPESRAFKCASCGRNLRGVPVYTGVVRVGGKLEDMFMRGEIAMMLDHIGPTQIDYVMTSGGLRPDQFGFGPPPRADEHGVPAAITGGKAWCINLRAARDPRILQAAWEYLVFQCSDEAQKLRTDMFVRYGYAHMVNPQLLKRFGYEEEYEDYEPSFREALESAPLYGRVQPHDPNYQHVESTALSIPVDTIVFQGGREKDPAKVITDSMNATNVRYYMRVPPEVQKRREFWGTIIFFLVAPLVVLAFIHTLRARSESHGAIHKRAAQVVGAGSLRRRNMFIALAVMAPALITVALWQYLPLLRGTVMAFYDFRLYGGGKFVGLRNFIETMTSPDFWNSARATLFYVGTSIGLGFCVPIILAIMLSEIPRAKVIYRTIYYLPAVTTGLVTMFLWKMFYAPSSNGFLNRLLMPVLHFFNIVGPDVHAIDWLHTPGIAMICVVLPGVWAGAGPGCLIYLAALKTVPEDLYEAISIDGGTIWHKIRYVMFPAIKALIMINFIGAFIGAFHAMQNVFVMTGGGPANSTRVLGIHIWANAFLYLRFGLATAMAWVLGSVLIGFTVMQLRILKKVEFRAAHRPGE